VGGGGSACRQQHRLCCFPAEAEGMMEAEGWWEKRMKFTTVSTVEAAGFMT